MENDVGRSRIDSKNCTYDMVKLLNILQIYGYKGTDSGVFNFDGIEFWDKLDRFWRTIETAR